MADWMMWLAFAGALVILELFIGTFYLLMVALGLVVGAGVALFGGEVWLQLLVAGVTGVLATLSLRRSRCGRASRFEAARDPNMNLDIGQTLKVSEWEEHIGSEPSSRASYRGAMWDVELAPGNAMLPGTFVIQEIRGNRLIVAAVVTQ